MKSRRMWSIKQVWNDTCRSQDQNERLWFVVQQVVEQYFSPGVAWVQGESREVQKTSLLTATTCLETKSGSVSP